MAQGTQERRSARPDPAAGPAPEEVVTPGRGVDARAVTEGDGGVVVADLAKGRSEVVRVQLRTYQGRRYVDVRTYFWDEHEPEEALRPTRKGVSLAAERLPELRGALDALAAVLAADR
jgi:hypothetical protein